MRREALPGRSLGRCNPFGCSLRSRVWSRPITGQSGRCAMGSCGASAAREPRVTVATAGWRGSSRFARPADFGESRPTPSWSRPQKPASRATPRISLGSLSTDYHTPVNGNDSWDSNFDGGLAPPVRRHFTQKRYDRNWVDPSEKIWNAGLSNQRLFRQALPQCPQHSRSPVWHCFLLIINLINLDVFCSMLSPPCKPRPLHFS